MTVTVDSFRATFPEFASAQTYPDAQVDFYIGLAGILLNPLRWLRTLDYGTMLFVAHNLALEFQAQKSGQSGNAPGWATGAVNNKSVDKVSVGFDVQSAMEEGAGHWNLTTYGTRFIRLARLMGMGPVQVGIGYGGNQLFCYDGLQEYLSSANAWQGPWPWNFPSMNE